MLKNQNSSISTIGQRKQTFNPGRKLSRNEGAKTQSKIQTQEGIISIDYCSIHDILAYWRANISKIEKWSYFNAMYFCFLCLITIGYGDYAPKTSLGRVFVSWAVGAVPLMTILVSNVGDTLYEISNDISAWFSTWMFSTKEEYRDLKWKKKKLQEDQEDQLTVNSEAVRSSELDEDLDLAKMEQEASLEARDNSSNGEIGAASIDNPNEDVKVEDNDTCITNSSNSNMRKDQENNSYSERSVCKSEKQNFDIERIRQKIASKKQVHEMLIDYLEK